MMESLLNSHSETLAARAEIKALRQEMVAKNQETRFRIETAINDQNQKIQAILDYLGLEMLTPKAKYKIVVKKKGEDK